MNQIKPDQIKHWYRYSLVWMIIFIPLSAVIMSMVLIWLAIDTNDGLVVDDYYKEGIEINRVLHRDEAATRLNISAKLNYANASRTVRLSFQKGSLPTYPATIQLHIRHATLAKKDHYVILQRGISNQSSGQYFGVLAKPLAHANWYFELSNKSRSNTSRINKKHDNRNWNSKSPDYNNWRLIKRFKVTDAFSFLFTPLLKKSSHTQTGAS